MYLNKVLRTPEIFIRDSTGRFTREMARKYVLNPFRKIVQYLRDKVGNLDFPDRIEIEVRKLPTYYVFILERVGNRIKFYLKPIAKIFGVTSRNRIVVDPVIFPEISDRERYLLKTIPPAERVVGEELIHRIQYHNGIVDRLKGIGRKAKAYLEGAAAYISDKLFGKTDIYSTEKREYERLASRYGERRAFLGECF